MIEDLLSVRLLHGVRTIIPVSSSWETHEPPRYGRSPGRELSIARLKIRQRIAGTL